MNAVGAINVDKARRAEHDRIPLRGPVKAVRGRIGLMIRLHFDQPAANATDQKGRPDQVGCDLVAARTQPAEALRSNARTTAQGASMLQRALVVLQAALSLVLLVAAGLFPRASTRQRT